jgi:hypothetical protein
MGNQISKLKIKFSLIKYKPDDEVVLVFVEKFGSRFITNTIIDKTVSTSNTNQFAQKVDENSW